MYMPILVKLEGKKVLEVIIYIYMFIVGITLGSFYTLAVHRIPLKQDITHTRSYCPKCNHRLNFWDLIPVLSFLFLGGKCRYCKEKIRPRYMILEILSGIIFLLFSLCLKIDLLQIEITKIVLLIFGIAFFSTVFITIGIYKEHKGIQKSVFNFGIIVAIIYMVYLYILNKSIYRYIIYVITFLVMLLINNIRKTKEKLNTISFIVFAIINIVEIAIAILI